MFFGRRSAKVEEQKIVIIGAGEVGYYVALRLAEENKQVVVLDSSAKALRRIDDNMDVQTICGSGSSPLTLREAGLDDAHLFLAVTSSDEVNILSCLFANSIAPNAQKLARIRNTEYTAHADFLKNPALNINALVNPEHEIVRTIDRLLTLPGAVEYGEFADGHIRMVGMTVHDGPLIGQPLMRFRELVQDDRIMVGAITRGQNVLVPSGKDTLQPGDIAYFVYLPKAQAHLLKALNRKRGFLYSACIVGGGNIGLRMAKVFENKGIHVTLIERQESRCEELADQLDKALILHGDGTDKALLDDESIGDTDAFIALTGDEESNIISCLLAKSLGVHETVARVNKAAYLPLLKNIGIEHSVSPRHSMVNSILQYVRQGKVLSCVSVGNEAAEVMEVVVGESSELAGRSVSQLGLPRGALLLAVVRGKEAAIPTGNTEIQADDHVLILALRSVISRVEETFAT